MRLQSPATADKEKKKNAEHANVHKMRNEKGMRNQP